MAVRVNKYLSEAGFCSRREADKMVEQGRVTIDGITAVTGSQVREDQLVEVDGERLSNCKKRVYIAFNKPPGVTCTTDPGDPTNIVDYINYPERIFNIGRLDKPSEGLIFLTNDGNIVNKILRAGNNHEKEYVVTVDKPITSEFAQRMSSGVRILGTVTAQCKFVKETETRFRITLTQGLNRQIRRMCEVLGYRVATLKRIRVMNINLAGLQKGAWRYFTDTEVTGLNRLISSSVGTEEASSGAGAHKAKSATTASRPKFKTSAKSSQHEGSGSTSRFGASKSSFSAKPQSKSSAKSSNQPFAKSAKPTKSTRPAREDRGATTPKSSVNHDSPKYAPRANKSRH